jgi:hypothetical protein
VLCLPGLQSADAPAGGKVTQTVRWTTLVGGAGAECLAKWQDAAPEIRVTYSGQIGCGWAPVADPSEGLIREADFQRSLSYGPYSTIFRVLIEAMFSGVAYLRKIARRDSEQTFARICHGSHAKSCLMADVFVQCTTAELIRDGIESAESAGPLPLIYGEESPNYASLDFSRAKVPVVGLDMLDGTLEFEQNTGLWCSSATVYDPGTRSLVGSFVLVPDRGLYFRMGTLVGMCRARGSGLAPQVFALGRPSDCTDLKWSVLACYAQKSRRHRALLDHPGYRAVLGACENSPRTEGGNPWILRTIDNQGFRLTDGVFELLGQAPHDWVPGAHIATACGAVLTDLDGQPIDPASVLSKPMAPSSRVPYILAANQEISSQLLNCLSGSGDWTGSALYQESAPVHDLPLARTA